MAVNIINSLRIWAKVGTRYRRLVERLNIYTRNIKWFFKDIIITRRTNRIVRKQVSPGDRIPKVIHYIWIGGGLKPDSVQKYIATWRKNCPDYKIIEWNEKNYNVNKNRYCREAYGAKKWAFVTDYMRLDILDRFGGIYMDSDVEVLKNLNVFLKDKAFSSFEAGDPTQVFLPTGMIASERHGLWVKYLKSYYSSHRSFFRDSGEIDTTTNTETITRMTTDKYPIVLDNKLQRFEDFTMYPSDYFCPKSWSTREINLTKNTYAIHHFAASWLPSEVRAIQHKAEGRS